MNKKERKASKRLEEAQKMVAKQCSRTTTQVKPKLSPLPIMWNNQDDERICKIVDACIMKIKKGEWRVMFRFEGDTTIRDKKCKSKTQAEEWVAKHTK